jgi:hypothetical protein
VDPDLDYDNSLTQTRTFKPTGNAIKVEFTEFATDYDFLEIYNGPTTSLHCRKIQGHYTPSFTSTAVGGNLTFRFTSDKWLIKVGLQLYLVCL